MEFSKKYSIINFEFFEKYSLENGGVKESFVKKILKLNYNLKGINFEISIKNHLEYFFAIKHSFIINKFLNEFRSYIPEIFLYNQKIRFIKKGEEKEDFRSYSIFKINLNNEELIFYFCFPTLKLMKKIKNLLKFFDLNKKKLNEIKKNLPLVFIFGTASIVFHEIVAHPLEADTFKYCYYSNKIGRKVSREFLTIYDDPGLENLPAKRKYDDEGIEVMKKALIEKGVVKNILCNEKSSFEMLFPPGNARISNVFPYPLPRSTNILVEEIKGNNLNFIEIYPAFILIPNIKKAYFFPPEYVKIICGPCFLYYFKENKGRIENLIIEGKVSDFLNGVDFIGAKREDCLTFGSCKKDGSDIIVGGSAPYVSFINLNYRL